MAEFDKDALEWLRTNKEVTIRTAKHPDTAVIIWAVVAADDAVYVRSVKGVQGRWYRDLASDCRGVLQVRDQSIPVQAIAANNDASIAQASEAFLAKYRSSSYVGSIVRAEVLSTTLRLEPFPGGASAD
jgi:hypothetical protein